LKTTKDQLINHYYKGKRANSLCHITDSVYLLALSNQLIIWNEETDQQLFKIRDAYVLSMRRVMTTNHYILRT
jgi:hypothetical protein